MLMGEEDSSGTVFYRGQYVCDSGWGPEEAKVVCRELGYTNDDGYVPVATRNSRFGQPNQNGASSWFKCSGSEELLSECTKMTGGRFCPPSHAAGVVCTSTLESSLELRDGSGPHEGNLYFQGAPVCSLNKAGSALEWNTKDKDKTPTVVCKMLGFSRATDTWCVSSPFPATTLPAKLSSVSCSGGQSSILECQHVLTEDTHKRCYDKDSSYFGKYTVGLRCEK